MEMNCGEANARLFDLLEGNLDDAERALVQNHLAECIPCRQQFDRISAARDFFQSELAPSTDRISAPPFLALRIKHRLSHDNSRWWRGSTGRKMWAAAAAAAILIAAGLVYNAASNKKVGETTTIAANQAQPSRAERPILLLIIDPNLVRELPRRDTMPASERRESPPNAADDESPLVRFPRAVQPVPRVQSPVLVKPVRFDRDM
jgi:hypothetical protein